MCAKLYEYGFAVICDEDTQTAATIVETAA